MSHSGSSEYPLPLTGPSSTSILSNSQAEQLEHQRVSIDSRGVNSSTKSAISSSSKDSVRESIKIYSVKKDHKRRSLRQDVNEKNRINNNHNIEQVIVII